MRHSGAHPTTGDRSLKVPRHDGGITGDTNILNFAAFPKIREDRQPAGPEGILDAIGINLQGQLLRPRSSRSSNSSSTMEKPGRWRKAMALHLVADGSVQGSLAMNLKSNVADPTCKTAWSTAEDRRLQSRIHHGLHRGRTVQQMLKSNT